jgi:hypothetical protein
MSAEVQEVPEAVVDSEDLVPGHQIRDDRPLQAEVVACPCVARE